MPLSELILPDVAARVCCQPNLTDKLLSRLRSCESQLDSKPLVDEQIWTLLCTYGFAVEVTDGINCLGKVLTGGSERCTRYAGLEMRPLPPRQGISSASERNSVIDLIVGDVAIRGSQVSGICYQPPADGEGWVCMVEAKYLSDIASQTTYDPCRNQMARVIETALAFQGPTASGPTYPNRVHFTLLTPLWFKSSNIAKGAARLYSYKFQEYQGRREALLEDIDSAAVPRRQQRGWQYPDLQQRLKALSLHWITYEQLIGAMPESDYKAALLDFIRRQPSCLLDLDIPENVMAN